MHVKCVCVSVCVWAAHVINKNTTQPPLNFIRNDESRYRIRQDVLLAGDRNATNFQFDFKWPVCKYSSWYLIWLSENEMDWARAPYNILGMLLIYYHEFEWHQLACTKHPIPLRSNLFVSEMCVRCGVLVRFQFRNKLLKFVFKSIPIKWCSASCELIISSGWGTHLKSINIYAV